MKTTNRTIGNIPDEFKPRIKYVKKANAWVRISVENGKWKYQWAGNKNDLITNI